MVPKADAGDILGGGIDVVEFVVASIHEGCDLFSNDMAVQNTSTASMGDEGDAEGVVVNKSKASCWTRRVRIGKAPEERDANPSRVLALEASMRGYADNKVGTVVNPALRTRFDTVEEACEFYNLYSWETGFSVRASHCNRKAARRGVDAPC